MTAAVIWCLVTGAIWTGIGIFFSFINRRQRDALLLNLCCAVILVPISAATIRWSGLAAEGMAWPEFASLGITMVLAGAVMAGGLVLMIIAMRQGMPDMAWAICQSSMVIPFLLGLVIHGEQAGLANIGGVAVILAGIASFSRQKKAVQPGQGASRHWFVTSAIAFFVIGAGQYLFSVPSFQPGWTDRYALRIPLQSLGGLVILLLLCGRGRLRKLDRSLWLHGLAYAVLTLAGRSSLYQAIDALARLQLVSLAYPVCLGLSILGFSACHAISQRKFSVTVAITSLLLVAGLFLVGIR
ncbi:hypothetical protein OpiT1DRAFT_00691 [Opitutaceae bacterium TAV1]|nr:hypothetical protein OpiT1DRAFT_00691 [Opitutaceae bacterium TAV1]